MNKPELARKTEILLTHPELTPFIDDLPYEMASRAFHNVSFSPEQRGLEIHFGFKPDQKTGDYLTLKSFKFSVTGTTHGHAASAQIQSRYSSAIAYLCWKNCRKKAELNISIDM